MKLRIKTGKSGKEIRLTLALILLSGLLGVWIFLFTEPGIVGQLYNNTSLVNTTINITNAAPMVYVVTFQDVINLRSYNTTNVTCNVTVFDFDNDSVTVNATLFINGTNSPDSPDDNNNHYSNVNCTLMSAQDLYMNYSCVFQMQYYADNTSNWMCNATAIDTESSFTSNESDTGTVNPLVAIKLPELIDYGDLAVFDISPPIEANVTNAGNRDVNISVRGWGSTEGDTLSFVCSYGVIPIEVERYDVVNDTNYVVMTQLTNSDVMIPDFQVDQRTDDSEESTNQTYWKVQVPIGAGGVCNGKVMFTATDRGD
ncbi:hypothetical protein JXC34_03765 [Candidatus Woesearchaeota archaeon]|nr:hypothetical protein [Candidatus Woesearchaeota archaeon]